MESVDTGVVTGTAWKMLEGSKVDYRADSVTYAAWSKDALRSCQYHLILISALNIKHIITLTVSILDMSTCTGRCLNVAR